MNTNNEKLTMKTEKLRMKRNFSLFTLLFSISTVFAQTNLSTSENYIYTKSCLDGDCTKKSESVQYFDGLGRPVQSVAIKATPLGRDVVVPIEYDAKGRQAKSYLPVPQSGTANGAIYTNPLANAASAGYGSEKIYSEKRFDDLFTTRVNQVVPVGTDWSQKPSNMAYGTNAANEVKKYGITTTWTEARTNSAISLSGSYAANQLMKTSVTDPDGNIATEFKNGKGQTILVRKNDGTQNVDTYYLHNEYGQLVYVISPLAVGASAPDQTILDQLCYQYRYDGLGRLVEKKVPGKGWEYMIYNKADQLVMSQDANLKAKNQWILTKYDQFGRIILTALTNNTATRQSLQTSITNAAYTFEIRAAGSFTISGMPVFYTNRALPASLVQLLSINYYDTYPSYSFNPAFPSTIMGEPVMTDTQNASVNTQAMPTLSLVKNIEDDNWTKNYVYYDKKGRALGTYSINHLGGITRTESELDFVGMAKQTKVYHKRLSTDTEKVITQSFDFDNQNRVLKHRHQVDSNPVELLTENTYNELSQLSNKKVGGGLESIDYQYDIRGALTKINDPAALGTKLFGYEMKYFNPQNTTQGTTGKYNGNVTEVIWKTATDEVLRQYNYQYDALNRLKKGIYSEPGASVPQNGLFNETLTYDLNGNITSLQRKGKGDLGAQLIDNLTYTYTGNRLNTVTDDSGNYSGYPDSSGTPISYDDNGNMKDHIDKGILQIDYNFFNQPDYVKFDKTFVPRATDGDYNVNTRYFYRADGTKLKKIYTYGMGRQNTETSKTTEYLDGFQYETQGLSATAPLTLRFVPTGEGYYNFENNKYIYSYTDHLGNLRLSYTKKPDGSIAVLEENNYYAFGLKHEGYNILEGNPAYNYGYNGKELQKESGWSDYGARMYMAEIGRWGVIDPLAEAMRRYSPYNYAFNNPVSFIDPDGMKPMNSLKMAGDGSNTEVNYGNVNPNWLGLGNGGGIYDQLETAIAAGGGPSINMDDVEVYEGAAAGDAFRKLMSPKNNEYSFAKFDFSKFGIGNLVNPNDVIFLNDSKSVGGLGHAAVIIGNEKDGWYYYSLNGTGGEKGRAYGDAIGADIGTPLGNISMGEAIKKANKINIGYKHNYDNNLALISSPSEDKAMMEKASKAASVRKYVLTAQDCLTVPMAAFNELKRSRGAGGPQTAKIPNAWRFFLPTTIGVINLYLPSGSELKYRK
ncbi:RHS repeat-associated core domain-containing protein [Chryseobacterium sp. L7]|uniref:RHS repeat-associated core domain-containing protein n=1 Tax=Chryseobacterium endalhagicum TaxID=2797638 RepID=A0ABS1QDA3_9FLAO|nr:DUF6443 domain-containing protein [Chryseobacterium endalhagicum]MBL1220590.1 RHS repeat-associated core domain-containing protein [Chryseobacterium endalhagicum]